MLKTAKLSSFIFCSEVPWSWEKLLYLSLFVSAFVHNKHGKCFIFFCVCWAYIIAHPPPPPPPTPLHSVEVRRVGGHAGSTFVWQFGSRDIIQLKINCQYCCCCWSLLYSVILCSRADSLHLHGILHEWLAFYRTVLNIHRSGYY